MKMQHDPNPVLSSGPPMYKDAFVDIKAECKIPGSWLCDLRERQNRIVVSSLFRSRANSVGQRTASLVNLWEDL